VPRGLWVELDDGEVWWVEVHESELPPAELVMNVMGRGWLPGSHPEHGEAWLSVRHMRRLWEDAE
jgi:hypothetical protein